MAAWGGIAGLQFSLSAVWTEASARGFALGDLARWMCERPAAHAGLAGRKGSIAAGHDADFVFLDAERSFRVETDRIHHRHKLTPYDGEVLRGVVGSTWLRGQCVYDGGPQAAPTGRWLPRSL
jgi:allantoinase